MVLWGMVFALFPAAAEAQDVERLILDSLYVTGDTNLSLAADLPFTQSQFEHQVSALLEPLIQRGYYYAAAEVQRATRNEEYIKLQIAVNKGPLVRIDNVLFEGLTRSSTDLLHRYLPVQRGDTLTGDRIEAVTGAAHGIEFVDFIPPLEVRPEEGYTAADLVLRFRESQPVSIAVGGGYIPDDPTGLAWHLDLKFNNLFGNGRRASILSEHRERGRNVLELGYRQPLFLIGPGDFNADLNTRDYRELFYEFSADAGYSTRIQQQLSAGMSVGYRSVEPAAASRAYSSYSAEFSIDWRTTSTRFNPDGGIALDWSIAYAYRRYSDDTTLAQPGPAAFSDTRTGLSIEWYQPLAGPFVGLAAIRYFGLETNEELPPISELFLLGGPGTIRGYRNEQFAVVRTGIITLEPRLQFANGYLFVFQDAAYLNNRMPNANGQVATDEDWRFGYGLGLALRNDRRSLKISFGWNKELSFDQPRLSVELTSDL